MNSAARLANIAGSTAQTQDGEQLKLGTVPTILSLSVAGADIARN